MPGRRAFGTSGSQGSLGHTGPGNADGRLRVPTASVTLSDMKAPVPWISGRCRRRYAGLAGLRSGRGRRGQGEHHCYQTGALSARLGGSDVRRAVVRVVVGGAFGLAFTYGVGHLFGTAIH